MVLLPRDWGCPWKGGVELRSLACEILVWPGKQVKLEGDLHIGSRIPLLSVSARNGTPASYVYATIVLSNP